MNAQSPAKMTEPVNLTPTPQVIDFPDTPFVYLEKIGPFMKTAPQAWPEFANLARDTVDKKLVAHMAGLSYIDHNKVGDDAFVYQAGYMVKDKPDHFPPELKYREIPGGKYARFVLTGPYAQLPHAYPAAFEYLAAAKLEPRDAFCMERYLNTPDMVAEKDLKTEILLPVK